MTHIVLGNVILAHLEHRLEVDFCKEECGVFGIHKSIVGACVTFDACYGQRLCQAVGACGIDFFFKLQLTVDRLIEKGLKLGQVNLLAVNLAVKLNRVALTPGYQYGITGNPCEEFGKRLFC